MFGMPKILRMSFSVIETYDQKFNAGTIAGACQPSRWAVTMVDVHASAQPGVDWLVKNHRPHKLWDLLGWGGGYHTGGETHNDYFPSLPFALRKRLWVESPRPAKFFITNFKY